MLKQANAGELFENILWAIATPRPWDEWEFIRRLSANSRELDSERKVCCQSGSPLFFRWHNTKVFAVLPSQRPIMYFSVPKWWSEKYESARCLAVSTAPYFEYCSSSLHDPPTNHVLWNVLIAEHCVLTLCFF